MRALLLALPLSLIVLTQAHDASACGGCLIQQGESTQVTGHKMILSVSKTQTTLWDQITYSGNPSSFAWVLPTKGIVQVGLSSDALFQTLEQNTQINIASPQIQCTPPPDCGGDLSNGGGFGTGAASASSSGGGPVNVVAQEVVGPYETVQLQSSDPTALTTWLQSHSYNIPADIAPVIDAYVKDGFNFLALKLVPGQGVQSMKPVRVTTPGASPVLPLRMVAAGTGTVTPITLWVMAEGRYETANFPVFTIDPSQVVWNWDTQSSNYKQLKQAGFDNSNGKAWLVEAGEPVPQYGLQNQILNLAQYDPKNSGYADDMGQGAVQAATDDLQALFSGIPVNAMWITRLHGELSRAALGADLELGASADQSTIQRYIQTTKSTGTAPKCPTYPPCPPTTSGGGWNFWGNSAGSGNANASGGCMVNEAGSSSSLMSGLVLVAAFALSRARRRRG